MYINLDIIVKEIMADRGESTPHNYAKYLNWAYQGIRDEIGAILPHFIKTVMLPINSNYTIDLPKDCIKVLKIGRIEGDRLLGFSLDDKMPLARNTDACGNETPNIPNNTNTVNDCDFFFTNYWWSGEYRTLFGYTYHNWVGRYRIDYERGQIQLNSTVQPTEVYIEYKCPMMESNGLCMIPILAAPALRAYIHMKNIRWRKDASLGDKELAYQEWLTALRNMRARSFSFTQKDFMDVLWRNYKQTIKN